MLAMKNILLLALVYTLAAHAADSLVVLTRPFQLAGGTAANNIKLIFTSPADTYLVSRSLSSSSGFSQIANTTSYTYDDYALKKSTTYFYKVVGVNGTETVLESDVVSSTTYALADGGNPQVYDNTFLYSTLNNTGSLLVDGVYYKYVYESDDDGFLRFYQQTSTDGYSFSGNKTVMERDVVCASVNATTPGLCKIERQTFKLHPLTGKIVFWGHFENEADYALGELCVAEATPGEEFDFLGAFRPLGYDSRDFTFFGEEDGSAGYILSATDTNTNMNVYSLTANWTDIDELLTTVLVSQYREAPAVEKIDGYYYLFTSNSAGWYPSAANYISATDMAGPWSDTRAIGDLFTFGTQSGAVNKIGGQYVMKADRWGANFDGEAVNSERLAPIVFGQGFASYEFYHAILYNPEESGASSVVAVQAGKVLSIGASVNATAASSDSYAAGLAVDGIKTVYTNYYVPSAVPFYYTIDLGAEAVLSQIDLLTRIVKGSETYYTYTVSGSTDGESYTVIADNTDNEAVGFVVNLITDLNSYRYVRFDVDGIINAHNGNSATWAAGINEITVYGTKTTQTAALDAVVSASVASGLYDDDFTVELSTNATGSGTTIYYSTDLATPKSGCGTKYTGAISVKKSTDLKAVAYSKAGKIVSRLLIADYAVSQDAKDDNA
ncbi:glycosyl hydrolase [Myxozyma melibiosi]|uniref:Glycosyl hydrolase n=1 Tax=Myxozyma melibiosi TaxID=54550 RepID=A0ABR1EZ15_9ASCO